MENLEASGGADFDTTMLALAIINGLVQQGLKEESERRRKNSQLIEEADLDFPGNKPVIRGELQDKLT